MRFHNFFNVFEQNGAICDEQACVFIYFLMFCKNMVQYMLKKNVFLYFSMFFITQLYNRCWNTCVFVVFPPTSQHICCKKHYMFNVEGIGSTVFARSCGSNIANITTIILPWCWFAPAPKNNTLRGNCNIPICGRNAPSEQRRLPEV